MAERHTIITIGRQFGSGGRLVALEIGRRLGIAVYDSELISKAAEESGFSKEFFKQMDEKKSILGLSTFLHPGRIFEARSAISDDSLFKIQSEVIRRIAEEESAVFVGRCSNYILRDLECLDVFIKASDEDRVRRIAERTGADEEKAREEMEKQDRHRAAYYNFFSFGDWGAASDYDLCLDSSLLGIEGTAEFIIDYGRKAGLIK